MRFTQLSEWLQWQESLHSSAIDLGLERVRAVAERMHLLAPAARVVSVAGTNGKGSCVATLETLCLAQQLTVGAFTSPHLLRYNERIRVNGEPVDDRLICESFERIDRARGDISLTYFEFGTLAAIDIFRQQGVEVMLLEVGLGGRLDAVNIMDADVAVVTSIALDHEQWLGSDLHRIGFEKAGIYRPRRWAICADAGAPASVADYAHEIGARWVAMGLSMTAEANNGHWRWQGIDADGEPLVREQLPQPVLPLPSVAAALQAFVLLGYPLPTELAGLVAGLSLAGRGQRLSLAGVDYWLDVAHNPAAAGLLAERLAAEPCAGRTWCLLAMMSDKDCSGCLQQLVAAVDSWLMADLPGNERAAPAASLCSALARLGRPAEPVASVREGLARVAQLATSGDRVVITGSFFTVAEALSALQPDLQ